VFLVTCDVRAV